METDKPGSIKYNELLKKAEILLGKDESEIQKKTIQEVQNLLNELQDHQIKLQIQNQELRRSIAKLKDSQQRCFNLYDSSPIGDFTFTQKGLILEANLAASRLLGIGRGSLKNKLFSRFIYKEDKDIFHLHLRKVLQTKSRQICELRAVKKDGTPFYAHLESICAQDKEENCDKLRTAAIDITELKKTEEVLRYERSKLINILNSLEDGVYITNQNYDIEYVNPMLKQKFGPINRQKCYTYFNDRKEVCPWCKNKEVFAGNTVRWEYFSPKTQKTYDLIDIPLKNPDGSSSKIVIFIDITERRKAQEALQDSEERYRTTINSMVEAIHVVDSELRFILFNRTFKEWIDMLGLMTDVIGKTVFDIFPFLTDKVRDEYQYVFNTGRILITEEYNKVGGREFITQTRKIPVIKAGRVNRVITIIRDITEAKKAEEALRHSEAKFRALSENSPNMIFINKGGKVVYVNKKCEEIVGYKKEEFYSPDFDFLALIAPESVDTIMENFIRHMKGEEIPPFEYTNITKTGQRIESLLTTKLIDYEGEKAILGIVTDITKLKRAEEVLKTDKEKIERLVQERTEELLITQKKLAETKRLSDIGMLAATVAHELRNPLAVIKTATYNAKRKMQNPLLEKHLNRIENSILESNQIINNLLFYSRIKTPNYETINIYHILNECVSSAKDRFKKKKFTIYKKYKSIEDLFIEADHLQIKELFNNILNNAYDALENYKWVTPVNDGY